MRGCFSQLAQKPSHWLKRHSLPQMEHNYPCQNISMLTSAPSPRPNALPSAGPRGKLGVAICQTLNITCFVTAYTSVFPGLWV